MRFGPGLLLLGILVACNSQEVQHSVRCSEGPAQYSETRPPDVRAPSANAASLPECLPICGGAKVMGPPYVPSYPYESLPSGACEFDGDHCRIGAGTTQTCGTEKKLCNQSELECFCEDDTWRCYVTSQGAGACTPCP